MKLLNNLFRLLNNLLRLLNNLIRLVLRGRQYGVVNGASRSYIYN